MSTTLHAIGERDDSAKEFRTSDPGRFEVREAVRMGASRSGKEEVLLVGDLDDTDVIELTFEGDVRRFMTIAEYRETFGQASRSDRPGELLVPTTLPIPGRGRERAITSVAVKLLRVFGFDPIGDARRKLAPHYDKKLVPAPGLFRLAGPDKLGRRVKASDLAGSEPLLIFVHGTASSTAGSFGKFDRAVWNQLEKDYGARIFAFEHHTLARHPIENALDLARVLPKNATLHLVSHSRGGLIGELICRANRTNGKPIDTDDKDLFKNHPLPAVRKALADLAKTLADRSPSVERFVRVACPAGGTILASKRLDRWLEVVVNVIPDLPVLDVLLDFVKDLKKGATDPAETPGVAAMAPGSILVRMLNRPNIELSSSLSVITGDVEGSGIWNRIGIFFTDVFYREDHDLVVHTRAMYGGAPRGAEEARFFFDHGADVNHFHYFSNSDTVGKVREGLAGEPKDAFMPIGDEQRRSSSRGVTRHTIAGRDLDAAPKPRLFVLPGIMGSHLQIGDDRIWLDLVDLAFGGLAKLEIGATDVSPESLVARSYEDLCEYLSSTHEVRPFPFDWRLPILDEARRLGEAIDAALNASELPVRILAHSMGGMVARAMFHVRRDIWDRLKERDGSRFVMLGTPNGGSFSIPRVLLGRDKLVRVLATIDWKNSLDELLKVVSRFPGLLGLLPDKSDDWDLLDPEDWKRLKDADGAGWNAPRTDDLVACRAMRDALEQSPVDAERMLYVAGVADDTPVDIEIDAKDGVRFIGTREGDGRVPWDTGILRDPSSGERVPTWYMPAGHGDLANHRDGFAAITDLLLTGETKRLSTDPPLIRAVDKSYVLRDDEIDLYPDQDELERLVLSMSDRPTGAAREVEPIHVEIAHGNLLYCKHAVTVGHYDGDALYGAELALDHALHRRLSNRRRLGLYPGPDGTCDVILQDDQQARPAGAIVIGLGTAGSLTARKLSGAVTAAFLEYGLRAAEQADRRGADEHHSSRKLKIASLLIGSGADGVALADSISSVIQGALAANELLLRAEHSITIEAVQFIELYKDKAILATKALREHFAETNNVRIKKEVQRLEGGRLRAAYREAAGWWNRLHIRATPDDRLVFTTPGSRARVEESSLAVQQGNIDNFIRQAVRQRNWDPNLSAAMFELMVPHALKGGARHSDEVLLVLDNQAARYPWELLHDRFLDVNRPLSVEVGMVRQLTTTRFRQQVEQTTKRTALVVGDPPSQFVPLPGAEAEAIHVGRVLEGGGYDVKREIKTNSNAVMTSLLSQDYRIVHLAGHGVFEYEPAPDRDKVTGMVLGDDVFLTAQEVRQMRLVPELVFVNCCHLGKLGGEASLDDPTSFAASFAEELIAMGVQMVVVAGWVVDDSAAEVFAGAFYRSLLRGDAFGDAVKSARAAAYEIHGERANSWGAYQCYGDPSYQLRWRDSGAKRDWTFVDPDELIAWLRNIASDADADPKKDENQVWRRQKLEKLESVASDKHAAWLGLAAVQDAFGHAYGALKLFDKAIEHYDKALRLEDAQVSLRALEQRANLRARRADADGGAPVAARRRAIKQSSDELEWLIENCGKTGERASVLSSAAKSLAMIERGKDRDRALRSMVKGYESALDCYRAAKADNAPGAESLQLSYPLTNALFGQALIYWRGGSAPDSELVEAAVPTATDQDMAHSDFWSAVSIADARVATAFARGDAPAITAVAADYQRILVGSPKNRDSVTRQIDFVIDMLEPGRGKSDRAKQRRALHAALVKLRAKM